VVGLRERLATEAVRGAGIRREETNGEAKLIVGEHVLRATGSGSEPERSTALRETGEVSLFDGGEKGMEDGTK